MNPASYKDVVTSRGFRYHYYAVAARPGRHTLVLVHGYPQMARDWRLVAPFLESKGYGVIAPDMLAYGGSDKPTDVHAYSYSLLARDIVDLLDAEGVKHAIAVGHDWGSAIVSRLANFFPERFLAYAFFSLSYLPPDPAFQLEPFIAQCRSILGYDNFGYWLFYVEDDAEELVTNNIDSYLCTLFAKDPAVMKNEFAVEGVLRKNLIHGFKAPLAEFMTGADKKTWIDAFRKGGFAAPLNYYRIMSSGVRAADDARVPADRRVPPVSSPLFFGATLRDPVCSADMGKALMTHKSLKHHNVTIRDIDGDHWSLLLPETAHVARRELLAWIEDVVTPSLKDRV